MGGGGKSSNDVANEQRRQEEQRIAAIQAGLAATNKIFDSPEREAQIQDFLAANRQQYFGELNRQTEEAQRQLRFSLARSGTYGGRQQVDAAKDLGEAHNRGVIQADRLAQGAANEVRQADEDARLRVIQLIQSGTDATTASRMATAGLRTSLEGARSSMNADALGTVFGGFSDMYKRSQQRNEERRAQRDLGTLYGTANQWGFGGNNRPAW